jgi:hypothetical protein
MCHRSETFRALAIVTLTGLMILRADAQLTTSSPFLPLKATDAAAPTAGAPLELRGVTDLGDGMNFRLVDTGPKKNGAWVRLNERDSDLGVLAKQYDAASEMLTVEYQGRILTLAMHQAKVASSGAAPNIPMGGIPMPMGIPPVAAVNATPVQEQQRLEAVAAEVARRRQLREQAAQQVGQGVPAPSPITQQMLPDPRQRPQQFQQNSNPGPRGQRGGGRGRGQ